MSPSRKCPSLSIWWFVGEVWCRKGVFCCLLSSVQCTEWFTVWSSLKFDFLSHFLSCNPTNINSWNNNPVIISLYFTPGAWRTVMSFKKHFGSTIQDIVTLKILDNPPLEKQLTLIWLLKTKQFNQNLLGSVWFDFFNNKWCWKRQNVSTWLNRPALTYF